MPYTWEIDGSCGSTCLIHLDMWRNKRDILPLNKEFICVAPCRSKSPGWGRRHFFPFAHSWRYTRDCDVCVRVLSKFNRIITAYSVGSDRRDCGFFFLFVDVGYRPGTPENNIPPFFYDNTTGCWLKQVNIFFIKPLLCWYFPWN